MAKANTAQTFKSALALHQRGEVGKAMELYQVVLGQEPDHIDANSLLGAALVQVNRPALGVPYLEKALFLYPKHAVAHANLGMAYHDLGKFDEAAIHYRAAVELDPNLVDAENNLGCLLREQGQLAEAEKRLCALTSKNPSYAAAHYNLGLVLKQQGDLTGAASCYRRAIAVNSRYCDAYYNLGNVLREVGDLEGATDAYGRALAIQPNYAEAICNLGVVYFKRGQLKEAAAHCLRAAEIKPDYADAYCNLGTIFEAMGDKQKSLDYYRRATDLAPRYAEALSNMAHAYAELDQLVEALDAAERALAIEPNLKGAWVNKGFALMKMERFEEARQCFEIVLSHDPDDADALLNLGSFYNYTLNGDAALQCYDKVLSRDPNNAMAHWNRGWILLARGNLEHGWSEYLWGKQTRERRIAQTFALAEWQGQPPEGKSFLVHGEQGVGDEILFASCLGELAAKADRCVLQCDRRLVTLFQRSFPSLIVHGAARDADPQWLDAYRPIDYQVPIGDLPVYYRRRIEDFAGKSNYLRADPAQVQLWRERLQALGPGLKVGIAWRSRLHTGLRARYFPSLMECAPFLTLPGVVFVNLQYDECAAELSQVKDEIGVTIHNFGEIDLFNDLDGSAALMTALDLVIAPSTTTFNLAAGCGAPTWLFFPKALDGWRLGAGNFPWFENAVVFEQSRGGDWASVAERIAQQLKALSGWSPSAIFNAPQKRDVAAHEILARALVAHQQGDFATAAQLYERVLKETPNDPQALALSGTLHAQQGDVATAQVLLERALGIVPHSAEILTNLGFVAQLQERRADEIRYYESALASDPNFVPGLENLTNALLEDGAYERAVEILDRWLMLDPRAVEAHYRLGMAQLKRGDRDAARSAWMRVLELDPSHARALNELGFLEYSAGKLDQAEQRYRSALRLNSDFREAHVNLGGVLTRAGRYQEAISHYDAVLAREPDYAPAHHNRSMALLALGQLQEGWREWAWRLQVETGSAFANLMNVAPLWKGEPLSGRTLLVHGEQGVGDELLFGTCLPDVVKMGGRVILQCDPRLEGLFQRAFPTIEVHAGTRNQTPAWLASVGKIDFQCPSGELPALLRPDLSSFGSQSGYLVADAQRRRLWRERLDALGDGLKVGIAWRGHLREALREPSYTQLAQWMELLSVPGTHFFNLQYGVESAEREQLNGRVVCFDDLDLFDDFESSAALMSELDLVISVEMATYNLAGALGVPTWLVSAHVPKRGWVMLGTDKIPSYPSVRVFRQAQFGDWSAVFHRLATGLVERVGQRGTHANVAASDAGPWLGAIVPLLRKGARVCIVGNVEPSLLTALQHAVGDSGRLDVYPAALEARRIPQANVACDLVVLGADVDAVAALVPFSKLIERFKPLMLFRAISDEASGALAALGYATTSLSVLLRRESAPNAWCAFPTVAHTREKPSAKYQELLSYYRSMHSQGYTRVVNGESVYTAAADAFPGNELPNYVRPVRALIRGTGARSILDYGAGKGLQYTWPVDVDGTHFQSVQKYWGIDRIEMYEPALAGRDRLPSQPLDAVVCTDVLEHIPESDVPWIVDEMFSLARKFVFASVACYPAMARLPSGENAHCTVRPPAWWDGLLKMTAARHPGVQYLVVAEEVNAGGTGLVPRWLSSFSLPE